MLPALLVLAAANLICLMLLLLRRPATPLQDPRLLQLAESLPTQLARLDTRSEALDANLRASLAQLRTDLADESRRTREASDTASIALRSEITRSIADLSQILNTGLSSFREDNKTAAASLTQSVHHQLDTLSQRLTAFTAETTRNHIEARESLTTKLSGLSADAAAQQEKLRATVEARLDKLNADNEAKLEQMRVTVDEKLQSTLQTRLTESFGQVTDQLNKVHTGLGEMTKLSAGVDDLSRIFTNVKSRGGFAEVQLGMLLEQMLAPSQFIRNARVKPNSLEAVEYAVRFPTHSGETLLPIDAKFPREDWERLENAYTANRPDELAAASKAFEAAIRTEGKRICEKYINPPATTPYAIMFLPTEGLYAEVMRRELLQAEIQSKCRVTIAGPSTLSAILTSFQMGFHMLALQEKGDEVWKVLESTKTEFRNFETLMGSMEKQVGTVQTTIQKLGTRTRAINRTLRDVSDTDSTPANVLSFNGVAPALAAVNDED